MSEANEQRKWVREEVVVLVAEYYRTKKFSKIDIDIAYRHLSNFLRAREFIITGQRPPEVFRDYAGMQMQAGRIRCLDPETKYSGMKGTKLQQQVVEEYLQNPDEIMAEAKEIYCKYGFSYWGE